MAKDGDGHDQILGRLMGLAGQVMLRRLARNLAEAGFDLTAEQGILLKHIDTNEGLNQKALTNWMFRKKAYMTRLIDSLEGKGVVVRVQDKADRRQNMIYLTPRGKEQVAELTRIGRMTEKQATAGIKAEKVATCKEVLVRVRKNLTSLKGA
jgi:DNA-binding MarR family transcriptional regulator